MSVRPALVVLFVAGILLRAGFLVTPHLDSDQAIFGLQAMHVLTGEYPAFSWGTAYIGTAPTFLTAVVFFLFGASRLTLDVVPTIETAFWLPLTYLLGSRLAGERGGTACMVLSALAPGYLVIHGAWARHGYMETVLLGTILFLLAERWWRERGGPMAGRRQAFVLGFVAGLAWWTNFLSIYFLAPIGLVVLGGLWRTTAGTFRSAAWGFGAGSLPFWIVNLGAGFPSLAMFGSGNAGHIRHNLLDFWFTGLPRLLALPVDEPGILKALGWMIYLGFLALMALAVSQRPPENLHPRASKFLKRLVLASVIVFPVIYSASSFGSAILEFGTLRYLLPVFVLVYPLVALGFSGERWSWAKRGLMISLIAAALVSNAKEYAWAWGGEEYQRQVEESAREERLFVELLARGLDRVRVMDYWQGPKLTFDSGERIIFAEMGAGRYLAYSRVVAASARSAFLLESDNGFEAQVRAMGAEVKRERMEGFEVYHGFRAPLDCIRSLPSDAWRVVGGESRGLFDRRPETKWTEPSGGGGRLEVDLGRAEEGVCGVAFFPGTHFPSRPRDLRIYTSYDGRRWVRSLDLPAVFGGLRVRDGVPILDAGGFFLHRFPARTVRRIRIESSGSASGKAWEVAEMFVLALGERNPARMDPAADLLAEGEESLSREKWSEAWRFFSLARIADPHSPEAHYGLARSLASARLPDSAGRERAAALAEAGFADEAAREYERLVSSRDVRGSDYLNLADTSRRLERHDAAERILREREAALAPPGPLAVFGSCFRLDGLRIDPSPAARGGAVEVSYQWGSRCSVRQDLGIFVHLEGAGGRRFQDDHLPLDGAYPTDRWPAGEVVRERRKVDVPSDLPPGEYKVFVGVVNRRLWNRRLPVTEPAPAAGSRFLAATLEVR